MADPGCRACGGHRLSRLLDVEDVPTQSCVLLTDPDEARAYPRGEIGLDACGTCGFVQNSSFRPELVDYSRPYEETQSGSPTFRAFQSELVSRLGKLASVTSVLEVGCGKGDFLAELCATTGWDGVGLDPSYDDDRRPGAAPASVDFRRELFVEPTDLEADLVVCRHTLEHIPNVRAFVEALRAAVRPGGCLFIEVPDAGRILTLGAVEDVYYEHCSYFTVDSLQGLLEACGVEVVDVRLEYGEQYLTILARVGGDRRVERLRHRPRPVPDADLVRDRFERSRDELNERLLSAERPALWGAGSKAVAVLAAVDAEVAARCAAVDINPVKWGTYLPGTGCAVLSPEALTDHDPDAVIVSNPLYVDEVREHLRVLGCGVSPTALSA